MQKITLLMIAFMLSSLISITGCVQNSYVAKDTNKISEIASIEPTVVKPEKTKLKDEIDEDPIVKKVKNSDESYFSKRTYQNKLTKWLKPYKIDVQQGNIITASMLDKLKIGMSKPEVKSVLGTPLLSGSASKNQWLYVYNNSKNGIVDKKQNLVLSFNNDKLADIKEETVINS